MKIQNNQIYRAIYLFLERHRDCLLGTRRLQRRASGQATERSRASRRSPCSDRRPNRVARETEKRIDHDGLRTSPKQTRGNRREHRRWADRETQRRRKRGSWWPRDRGWNVRPPTSVRLQATVSVQGTRPRGDQARQPILIRRRRCRWQYRWQLRKKILGKWFGNQRNHRPICASSSAIICSSRGSRRFSFCTFVTSRRDSQDFRETF